MSRIGGSSSLPTKRKPSAARRPRSSAGTETHAWSACLSRRNCLTRSVCCIRGPTKSTGETWRRERRTPRIHLLVVEDRDLGHEEGPLDRHPASLDEAGG